MSSKPPSKIAAIPKGGRITMAVPGRTANSKPLTIELVSRIKRAIDPGNISSKIEPDRPVSKSKLPNAKISTKKHQEQIQPKNLQHEDHSDTSTQDSGLPGGYMSEKKVIALIGMARSTINLMQDENSPYYAPTFPKKRKLGTRRVAYKVSEVMQWIDSRDKVTPSARKKAPQ